LELARKCASVGSARAGGKGKEFMRSLTGKSGGVGLVRGTPDNSQHLSRVLPGSEKKGQVNRIHFKIHIAGDFGVEGARRGEHVIYLTGRKDRSKSKQQYRDGQLEGKGKERQGGEKKNVGANQFEERRPPATREKIEGMEIRSV